MTVATWAWVAVSPYTNTLAPFAGVFVIYIAHRERSHSLQRSYPMGVLADALRENLRQLALSDARRLRELDKILNEARETRDRSLPVKR